VHDASGVIGQAWISGHLRSASRAHQALKDRIAIATDNDVLAVTATIRIRRHNPGERRARRLAHHAGAVIFRHHGLQHIKDGFVNRHVDDLTNPLRWLMALNIGQQDTQHRVQTCQGIAQAQIGAYWWRTGEPVDMPKATNAFTHRGKSRSRGIGTGLTIA
jgi:hypothetical protein